MLRQKSILSLFNSLNRRTCHFGSSTHILSRSDPSYNLNRYYSKKSTSGSSKNEGSTKTERVIPSSATLNGCKTTPVPECQPKNQVKTCPPPSSQHDESSTSSANNYNKRLIAAALLTAGTVYSIWKLNSGPEDGNKSGSKPKKPASAAAPKIPAVSSEIPSNVQYLLIGGGTASFSAFRAIKARDARAKVLIIGNERYLPYMRPPLSKEMWFDPDSEKTDQLNFKQWNGSEKSVCYEPEDFFVPCNSLNDNPKGGVALAQGWKVERIDPFKRIAYLEDGHEIAYEKCLLATGAKPKTLDVFEKAPKEVNKYVSTFRGIPDYLELNEVVKEAESVAIVGGGFLGSELACALARRAQFENPKMKVYQIFKEPGNLHKVLPEYLSLWTTKKVANEGVEILSSSEVQDVSLEGKGVSLHLKDGRRVKASKVVVAVGVKPNTELAEKSGLEVDPELGGFLVNTELEARSNLYAAGDCSCFYDVKFGRRRVEHHDHAVISGRLAGENMVGAGKPYSHQSMFWSDLGPYVGFEAIGIVDSSLPTVAVFAKASERDNPKAEVTESDDNIRSNSEANNSSKPVSQSSSQVQSQDIDKNTTPDDYGKGVIFYLKDDLVVGMVLWNVFRKMSVARRVLEDNRKYEDLNEVAKLFKLFEE